MGKTTKGILIGFGVILIFTATIAIAFISNIKSLKPTETAEITEGVFAIKDDYSNMYLIKDGEDYLAIDAAINTETVKNELAKLGIQLSQINAILLTHTDNDHVGALSLFPSARIYISLAEEQMINGETNRAPFSHNKIYHKNYTTINDQQEFQIGGLSIKGISTPGHTPGAMCYLINKEYLFVGDALSIKDRQVGGFNKIFNMDTEQAFNSISLISNLPNISYIFSAHYGYTSDYNYAFKGYKSKQ